MAGVLSLSYGVASVSIKPLDEGRSPGIVVKASSRSSSDAMVVKAAEQRIRSSSRSSSDARSSRKCARNASLWRRDFVLSAAIVAGAPMLQSLFVDTAPALIEADDDEELLEKVKGDRLKRIQNQGATSELKDETASLQVAVYKLSKAGQAIEKDDLVAASSILGTALDTDWIAKIQSAFEKVSKNPEQQGEAERFTSSLGSLQTAVFKQDAASAKSAFVASATALEKWTSLAGLTEQIKGL